MRVIAPGVVLGHQGSNPLAHVVGEGPGGGPIAVTVDQCRGAVLLIGGFETPDLAFGHTEHVGGFGYGAEPGDEAIEDCQPVLLLQREGNG
jgi:hypothetical protein